MRDRNAIEILQDRNPVDFLRRRADALGQRAAEVKRLSDAWQPLYETLNTEQKRRLGVAAIFVFREIGTKLKTVFSPTATIWIDGSQRRGAARPPEMMFLYWMTYQR